MTLSDRYHAVFFALSDPTRRRVLQQISERGSATATELAGDLPVSRQAIAKHLASLGSAGLVSASKTGREVRYAVTPEPLEEAVEWMMDVGARWDERLARLRAQF